MARLVANTYATAIFELGVEESKVKIFQEELKTIKAIFIENMEFLDVLKTPSISATEKKKLLDNVFKEKIDKDVLNFLKLLVDKRRFDNLLEIIDVHSELADKHNGIVRADIYSSFTLSEDQINKLTDKLSKKTNKTVILNNIVDKNLIGGLKLVLDDKIVDGSIKGKLEGLSDSLSKIIV